MTHGRFRWKRIILWVTCCALLAVGWYFLHKVQMTSIHRLFLEQATHAEEKGNDERALRFLRHYLLIKGDDVDALARFAVLAEKLAQTPRGYRDALTIYEQVLAQDPAQQDIRQRAAKLNIRFRQMDQALAHLVILQKSRPDDADVEILLGDCKRAQKQADKNEQQKFYVEARSHYEKALKKAPNKLEVYRRLAHLLRSELKEPNPANKVLEDLIRANPKEFHAYLIRAAYRQGRDDKDMDLKDLDLEGARNDLAEAEKLAPNDVDVLLGLAYQDILLARENGRINVKSPYLDTARNCLQRAYQLFPEDLRVLGQLAALEMAAQRPEDARKYLQKAQKIANGPSRNRLLWDLANVLIDDPKLLSDQKTLDETHEVILQLKKGRLPTSRLDFLEARMAIRKGEWHKAVDLLETSRPLLVDDPILVMQADLLLGTCFGQLLNADQQLAIYQRARKLDPLNPTPRYGLINAMVALGRLDDAIAEFQSLRQLPQSPGKEEGRGDFLYARLLILKNFSLGSSVGSHWDEVMKFLDDIGKANPRAPEVDVLRAEVSAAQGKPFKEIQAILELAKAKAPQDIEPWIALANLEGREGRGAEALKILDQAKTGHGDLPELRQARLRFVPSKKEEAVAFLRPLSADLEKFKPALQGPLLVGLAEAFERAGDLPEAEKSWLRLVQIEPNQLRVQLLLFDFYLRRENRQGMVKTLANIKEKEGPEGAFFNYGNGQLLIFRARNGEKNLTADARRFLLAAAIKRPGWSRIHETLATIAEMEGSSELTVKHLRDAVTLGSRSIFVIRALVAKLMENRQYAEADDVIRKLQEVAPISSEMKKLAAEISIFNENTDRALGLALSAVDSDSKNYKDYVWKGQILGALGKTKEAESSLRQAIEMSGDALDPWVVLIQLQAGAGEFDQAKATMDGMKAKVPAAELLFALAQCYQALNDKVMAEKTFQDAVAAQPDNLVVAESAIKFLINNGKSDKAEPQLRRILDSKKAPENLRLWARRNLALCLAFAGSADKQSHAMGLVEENLRANPSSVDDQMVKGILFTTKPAGRSEGIKILEKAFRAKRPTADQMFILANLYDQEGDWAKGRACMLQLVTANAKHPKYNDYLAAFVGKLLVHEELNEADIWLAQLQALNTHSFVPVDRLARLHAKRKRAIGEIMAPIKSYLESVEAKPADPALRLALTARLLSDLVRLHPDRMPEILAQGEPLLRSFADKTGKKESLLAVAGFLGSCQRTAECLDLCDLVAKELPSLLVVTAAVEAVANNNASVKQIARVEDWVATGRQQKPDLVQWDTFEAVLKERQSRFPEAEALYRKVLARQPNNVVALNNLAFLLANRGQEGEAFVLIEKAIAVVGPAAEVLDSRAVILRTQGKFPEAERDIRDALRQEKTPYRLFHLAQIYRAAGDAKETMKAFDDAQRLGFRNEMLHPLEREGYQQIFREYEQFDRIKKRQL